MKEVQDKVAVVTGAASGIGRGMAQAFADAGMKVVLSDVQEDALETTTAELREAGRDVHAVVTDVGKVDSVNDLLKQSIAKYGKVHVLCNNAGIGIGGGGRVWETTLDDWEWILDVNLKGVIYGVRAFVPHMLEHGEGGHVVNTASLAGLLGGSGAYGVTKFGVVSLSETLFQQLQQTASGVSASVLCPGFVNTNIFDSERNRPDDRSDTVAGSGDNPTTKMMMDWFRQQLREGLDPRAAGDMVLDAIRNDTFYVLTHPDWNPLIERRMRAILDGENPPGMVPPGAADAIRKMMQSAKKD